MKVWKDSEGRVHQGSVLGGSNGFDVIDCSECGFKHVVPIPTEDFLSEYYKNEFVKNRPQGFYKKMESDVPWLSIFYNEKYDLFEKYVKSKTPSILDIGSGLGYFCHVEKIEDGRCWASSLRRIHVTIRKKEE